jgi:hypothetical protein
VGLVSVAIAGELLAADWLADNLSSVSLTEVSPALSLLSPPLNLRIGARIALPSARSRHRKHFSIWQTAIAVRSNPPYLYSFLSVIYGAKNSGRLASRLLSLERAHFCVYERRFVLLISLTKGPH